jgi:hypothetical protein
MMQNARRVFYWLLMGSLIVTGLFALVTGPASARSLPYSSASHWQAPLTVDTSERCSGALSSGWTPTGLGPQECSFKAWKATTPTQATADYHMGTITQAATYGLVVYIPSGANAFMNYDLHVGSALRTSCQFNQGSSAGWAATPCSFTVGTGDIGKQFTIHEWSGQASAGRTLAHSAIQLV